MKRKNTSAATCSTFQASWKKRLSAEPLSRVPYWKNIEERTDDKKMKIFFQDLDEGIEPDGFCLMLFDMTMPDWIPQDLRDDMVDSLRGFNAEMSLEIADNLVDCWSGLGLHVTGINHVDELLGRLYIRILGIAHRQGVSLPYWK